MINTQHRTDLIKQLTTFVGVVGAATLLAFPAVAQKTNPNPEILQPDVFSKPPYNRGSSPQSGSSVAPSSPAQEAPMPASSAGEITLPSSSSPADAMPVSPGEEMTTPSLPTQAAPSPSSPTEEAPKPQSSGTRSIIALANQAGSFKILTTALQAAGLTETLEKEGSFTVFAPTDEAFAALPPGTVEELLKPENKATLTKILTYHVVPGTVKSSQLKSGEVNTIEGSPIQIKVESTSVMVNDAKVVKPDLEASNGVIHVIDKVILPQR